MPRASVFLELALGVMAVTRCGAIFFFSAVAFGVTVVTRCEATFCLLAGAASFSGSGNGPSVPKTMVRGVEVDPEFRGFSETRPHPLVITRI